MSVFKSEDFQAAPGPLSVEAQWTTEVRSEKETDLDDDSPPPPHSGCMWQRERGIDRERR